MTGQMEFADEDLLLLVADEITRGELRFEYLDPLSRSLRMDRLKLVEGLKRLDQQGLITLLLGGPGHSYQDSVGLTKLGQDRSLELGVLQAAGRVEEFANELDELARAIVDAVVLLEQQVGGASIRAGDIRTRVRRELPRIEAATVTEVIRVVSPSFLVVNGEQHRPSLRGLLASRWGMNAVEIIDHTLRLLRTMQEGPRPLRNFSWGRLLDASGLPHRARHLAYLAITLSGLGTGLFQVDEDTTLGRGWSVPGEIDLFLESDSTVAFVQARAREEARAERSQSRTAPSRSTPAGDVVRDGAGDNLETYVFGHLVRALVELAKKPARVVGKDEDDITDLVDLALGSLKDRFGITCNPRMGHGPTAGEGGVVDLSFSDRTDGRVVVTGEAKRWNGQGWATEAFHQILGTNARTETFLLVLLYCQSTPLEVCAAKTSELVANFFVPEGQRRLFVAVGRPDDVTPPETRLIVRALRSVHVVDPEAPSTTRTIYTLLVDLADLAGKAARRTSPKATKGAGGDGGGADD